jgi:MHS family proline/betaine transporter-like MFS transporter
VLIGVAAACAAGPITLFALMASGGMWPALIGAVLLAGLGGAVSAVGAVATAEQFSGEARLSGLALGVTSATAVFGGLTPLAAQMLLEASGCHPAGAVAHPRNRAARTLDRQTAADIVR